MKLDINFMLDMFFSLYFIILQCWLVYILGSNVSPRGGHLCFYRPAWHLITYLGEPEVAEADVAEEA